MDLKENTKNFEVDLLREHDRIITYLQKNGKFQTFIRKSKHDYALDGKRTQSFSAHQKGILIKHFITLCMSYGSSMSALYKNNSKVKKHKSYTANVTKRLNYYLKEYSYHSGIDIEHPIQVFTMHLEKPEKISSIGFYFACARTGISPNRKHFSYDNITLDEAIERGTERRYSTAQIMHKNKSVKYFRDMRDVLKWDEKNIGPVWFRKSGPLAADFRAGYVYERKELLNELEELVANNKLSILEGHGGSGKSVLIRNYAYNLISRQPDSTIYHFSFKTDAQIVDFHDFLSVLNSVTGLVIVEDIHLNAPEMQYVVDMVAEKNNSHFLLTARGSYISNMSQKRQNTLAELPKIKLEFSKKNEFLHEEKANRDIDEIIQLYANQSFKNFTWNNETIRSIKEICEGDLWLLSYALEGCTGLGEPIQWIEKGTKQDLLNIEKEGDNPEILIALSPLYQKEYLTARSFLINKLSFDRNQINNLVEKGEVIFLENSDGAYYGLPHSSLAKAYLRYGEEYRAALRYPDYGEFLYQYAVSNVSNSVEAMLSLGICEDSGETAKKLWRRLAVEKKALKVFENEQNCSLLQRFSGQGWFAVLESIDSYYRSKEFIESCMTILIKKRLIWAAAELYRLHPGYGSDLWKGIEYDLFKDLFKNTRPAIYFGTPKSDYCDTLIALGKIVKANVNTKSDIQRLIAQYDIVNKYPPPSLLMEFSLYIEALFIIDEDLTEKVLSDINVLNLAKKISQSAVYTIGLPDWEEVYEVYRFYEMDGSNKCFCMLCSIELLIHYIKIYQNKDLIRIQFLLGTIGITRLKELLDRCPVIVKVKFLLLGSNIQIKFSSLFKYWLAEIITEYVDTFMVINNIPEMYIDETYLDNMINDTDPMLGQNLFKYICKEIGLGKYMKKIKAINSVNLTKSCYTFFSKVDPCDKQAWKSYWHNENIK